MSRSMIMGLLLFHHLMAIWHLLEQGISMLLFQWHRFSSHHIGDRLINSFGSYSGSNDTGIGVLGTGRYLHVLGSIVIGGYFFGHDTRCDTFSEIRSIGKQRLPRDSSVQFSSVRVFVERN